ncbi:helix-turn-helix domain-containing protein [Catellatospora vulcania]|uniref:helix-turn-helix domain-containing protein n=1 Tax=Catellatospora vulcania TaxID=1460450 RepID=UPI0012D37792|nr:helix-turn-helix domain-containing protein [Catellatospora vulcania]
MSAADRITLDPRTLRGLAHPLRVRLLGLLRERGPSTATLLAAQLGQSSAATSYHLRQLALYGFVTDEPARGNNRERWWRAAHRGTTVENVDPESFGDFEAYLRAVAAQYAARVDRALDEYATRPPQWQGVGTISDWTGQLTPEETHELQAELFAVFERYRRFDLDAAAPEGTARVHVQFQVLPFPEEPA